MLKIRGSFWSNIKIIIMSPLFVLNSYNVLAEEYIFDESLLLGSRYNSLALKKVSQVDIPSGKYQVDLFINDQFVSREILFFHEHDKETLPCINDTLWLNKVGVLSDYLEPVEFCDLGVHVRGATYNFNAQKLRLNIAVPQAYLNRKPRGYTSPETWNTGETALFTNYYGNYYHSENSQGSRDSAYVGLNSGFNYGLWRVRNHSSVRHSDLGSDFTSFRTYANRAIPKFYSELGVGQLSTRSIGFGSLAFTGIQLHTDNRMLPISQRGFAPVVRGIAQTTAKVVIKQDGKDIYTTTVAAGPFVVDDLFPTSYQGDLLVEVHEANGQVSSFIVPFSAVPGSMRSGRAQYALSLGKNRNTGNDDYFADFVYEIGLSNSLTLNSGIRVADGYQALSAGSVINTPYGALGGTAVYSHAKIDGGFYGEKLYTGWRAGLNYSRAFSSGTAITLAGYKYSTEGYRELTDVFQQRYYFDNNYGYGFSSASYLQKTEMSLNMTQQLGDAGSLSLSATKRQYRNGRGDDDSYNLSYYKQIGIVNLGLNYSRMYTSKELDGTTVAAKSYKNDVFGLSLSLPLGSGHQVISSNYTHTDKGSSNFNIGLSGTLENDPTFSYGISTSYQGGDGYESNSFSASASKRTNIANLRANYSQGHNYRQISASANGAVVLHKDGVILGQSVGETFAIIEAADAQGAKVRNNWGSELNSKGYGLMSSLVPYRSNRVVLDSGSIDDNVELLESQQVVIPSAGAVVRLKYDTRKGLPVLFSTKLATGEIVPLGAEILGDQDENIGTVGQAGLAYVRLAEQTGKLRLVWGEGRKQHCQFNYDLTGYATDVRLLRLPAVCSTIDNR
ncbi:fimbria/pilus outer membrane usher protein [Vibrio metschnikovii]|uniref:Fimbrial biogenesis outer membrane usher protein n=1 Tax=bacterium 19CA03SA04 TaxID=2920698 RepID=A0AAU6T3F7_UNCXX